MRILVTGGSGYIASQLLQKLIAAKEVDKIIVVDVAPLSFKHEKIFFVKQDIRQEIFPLLKEHGIEVVFHFAFILNPIHDLQTMFDINVRGTAQLIRACERAGVKRFIYASSATVYGASPYNPIPIPESYPVDPKNSFSYPRHKAKNEVFIQKWKRKSRLSFTLLRPAVVFGPHVQNFMSKMLDQPKLILIRGEEPPPIQLVHEEDVAEAFYYAYRKGIEGIYNIAGDGTFTFWEGAREYGKEPVFLPFPLVSMLALLFWTLHMSPAPPQYLDFVRYPWVIDNQKFKKLGFKYRYSSRDTLLDFIRARGKA